MSGQEASFDLLVIGGGINGCGIARDAAARGLRVGLVEQADLCHGTSRWSSRLIHGGLRYLEHQEFRLVRESLRERETLLWTAPHLVHPLPLLVPLYQGARRGRWLIRAGLTVYDLLSLRKSLPPHRLLSSADALRLAPGLKPEGLAGAGYYFDAQAVFPERLVVENAVAAARSGAEILTRHRVERILVRERRVQGVECLDLRGQRRVRLAAAAVVNAAGPWVDRVLAGLDRDPPDMLGGSKGTHIVLPRFPGAPLFACYAEARSDGRPYFIIPWQGLLLVGTTDIRYRGDPDDASADPAEIDYLLAETRALFPAARLGREDILFHYTGVRPLPAGDGEDMGEVSRRHWLRHHGREARGLYSVIGGKLTTYRSLAEEVVDRVCSRLRGARRPCMTRRLPLPGANRDLLDVAAELAAYPDLPATARPRLLGLYGARAIELARLIETEPRLGHCIDERSGLLAAELLFATDTEFAGSLADLLLRRCMVGLGPDLGRSALPGSLQVAGEFLGWDQERQERERADYLAEIGRLRSGLPDVPAVQWRQSISANSSRPRPGR